MVCGVALLAEVVGQIGGISMTHRQRLFGAATAVLVAVLPVQTAFAACVGAFNSGAVWHLHVIQAGYYGGAAVRCIATFGAAGAFTGPCTNFETGMTGSQAANVSGKLTLTSACDFTGSVTIPDQAKVIVRFGHINGNVGSAIGTQGAGSATEVLQVNLIRK